MDMLNRDSSRPCPKPALGRIAVKVFNDLEEEVMKDVGMSGTELRLAHAPIIEAVVSINCDLPPQVDFQRLQASAKERLRDFYPRAVRQAIQHYEFRKEGEKPPEMSAQQGSGALMFHTEDGKQIIQFRPEGYSFNRLAPYSSLDTYMSEIERTWKIFREIVQPIQIRHVGLRFINRLPLPTIGGQVDLSEYLKISPQLPDEEAMEFVGFLHQHSAVEVATGNQVNITLVMQPLDGDKLPIILDIDAFRTVTYVPEEWAPVVATIHSLRSLKNRVFERTLTPKCLSLFQQP
jgi:uncharacterized protein (TIGR04255 family)